MGKSASTYRVFNACLVTAVGQRIMLIVFEVVWIFIPLSDSGRLVQVCHCLVSIISAQGCCVSNLHFPLLTTHVWSTGNEYVSEPDLLKPRNLTFVARTHSIPSFVQDSQAGIFSSPRTISTSVRIVCDLLQGLTFDVSNCRLSFSRAHAHFETR